MNKMYDYVVYIGRFQPFHDGHLETSKLAEQYARKGVIYVLGSSNTAPTPKNPWSAVDRMTMIESSVSGKSIFLPVEDRLYNENKWFTYVQSKVDEISRGGSVALIGHEKDETSFYLKNHFKSWDFIETGAYVKEKNGGKVVSSTKIRELMFEDHLGYTNSNIPPSVYEFLEGYIYTEEFKNLKDYYDYILEQQALVRTLPHGMPFITVDSLVVQSANILLVKREEHPGKGLWALPGVHLGHNETLQQASIRAIYDETHIKVSERPLMGSFVNMKEFDHPDRSLRARLTEKNARTLTLAYYYKLSSDHPLPKVKAGNGVEKAWWFTFAEVKRMKNQIFEDHSDIIDYFI